MLMLFCTSQANGLEGHSAVSSASSYIFYLQGLPKGKLDVYKHCGALPLDLSQKQKHHCTGSNIFFF